MKENIKTFLKNKLKDKILSEDVGKHDVFSPAETPGALTFEKQKELLMLKLENNKMIPHKLLQVMKQKSSFLLRYKRW